jgi:hypothetical protein
VLLLFAIVGLVHMIQSRGAGLAHVGGALALLGVVGSAAHLGFYNLLLAGMAEQPDSAAMAGLADALEAQPLMGLSIAAMLLGTLFGWGLLAGALWRARIGPVWAAVAIWLGLLAMLSGAGLPAAAIGTLLTTIGFGTVGVRALRAGSGVWPLTTHAASATLPTVDEPVAV